MNRQKSKNNFSNVKNRLLGSGLGLEKIFHPTRPHNFTSTVFPSQLESLDNIEYYYLIIGQLSILNGAVYLKRIILRKFNWKKANKKTHFPFNFIFHGLNTKYKITSNGKIFPEKKRKKNIK